MQTKRAEVAESEMRNMRAKVYAMDAMVKHAASAILTCLTPPDIVVHEPLHNIWCYYVIDGGMYVYSFVSIRDKVAHRGSYPNVGEEIGVLCMIGNILNVYGTGICINTVNSYLHELIVSSDKESMLSAGGRDIATDLLGKGVLNCRFRVLPPEHRYEGIALAAMYLGMRCIHHPDWTLHWLR